MSIIFGIRKNDGELTSEQELRFLAHPTKRYAADGLFIRTAGSVGMGFQPYYTHQRSNLEAQVAVDRGNMLTFDGRLDNHAELRTLLNIDEVNTADSFIVLAAFARWDEGCFSRLIGDWALALWSRYYQSLYLARDHAGSRTLYFEQTGDRILWSTYLETLFADTGRRNLDRAFAARYLSCQSISDLTPYDGIAAVTPAHYFVFHHGKLTRHAHWEWMVKGQIRYQTAAEYEEHFRVLFRQSVDRRTGPGAPVLAQLSGGMDSSSIVCMSDSIRNSQHSSPGDLLETVSYFDDSEPNWNEKPYFTVVEEVRGKPGIHIDISRIEHNFKDPDPSYLLPGADSSSLRSEQLFEERTQGKHRVILSGIGGDELLGGVPNPVPELADYLVCGHFIKFLRRSLQWCVPNRTPLVYLIARIVRSTSRLYPYMRYRARTVPPWVKASLDGDVAPIGGKHTTVGLLPSAIGNGTTWWSLVETLPHYPPAAVARREFRYPYLDRDLVDYLFRVPRERLLQPGFRRSLMRQALRGLVPDEILNRRRKAFAVRRPLVSLGRAAEEIRGLLQNPLLDQYDLIKRAQFDHMLEATLSGRSSDDWKFLLKAVELEIWLRAGAGRFLSP